MNGTAIDRIVDHYRIIDKIGSGGMGEVFLAEDTKLKRQDDDQKKGEQLEKYVN